MSNNIGLAMAKPADALRLCHPTLINELPVGRIRCELCEHRNPTVLRDGKIFLQRPLSDYATRKTRR